MTLITKTSILIVIIILTGIFFIVELVVGHLTKSNALIADAFHMLSDLIALIIGLTAVRWSKKQSTEINTFGWSRAEILGSLVNCVFLLALCFTIIVEAVKRFIQLQSLENIDLMLYVGAGGLLLNLVSLVLLQLLERFGKRQDRENLNMKAVFLNALGDSLGSVAVMISGLVVKYVPTEDDKWKKLVDPFLSLFIATIIISTVIPLLKRSSLIILQTVPSNMNINEIKQEIYKVEGVVDIHHFHVWSLSQDKLIATAHIRVDQDNDQQYDARIVKTIKRILHSHGIHSTTIQLEHFSVSIDSCDSQCECGHKCCDQLPDIKLYKPCVFN